jgi:hypothetical protein
MTPSVVGQSFCGGACQMEVAVVVTRCSHGGTASTTVRTPPRASERYLHGGILSSAACTVPLSFVEHGPF